MTEHKSRGVTWDWMSPSTERLFSKITYLEETLEEIKLRSLTKEQGHFVTICDNYLEKASDYIERPSVSLAFPFFSRKHPHLVWELLHRVDEYFILLITNEELVGRAIEVKTQFDLNIKEEKVRNEWIAPKGRLTGIIEQIQKKEHPEASRHLLRDALRLVNEQMDRTFWQLSANTLTSVWSAAMLGVLLLVAWKFHSPGDLHSLGSGGLGSHFATLIALGLMGAYLSNLMTKEDFLYVRGAPYLRYFLQNIMAKPVMSAFAAVFIYIVEQSKLIFSMTPAAGSGPKATLISLNVSPEHVGYAFAVLAIVSAFAADKILRSTIDSVLKRMEQKAEKTKDSAKK